MPVIYKLYWANKKKRNRLPKNSPTETRVRRKMRHGIVLFGTAFSCPICPISLTKPQKVGQLDFQIPTHVPQPSSGKIAPKVP